MLCVRGDLADARDVAVLERHFSMAPDNDGGGVLCLQPFAKHGEALPVEPRRVGIPGDLPR